MLTSTLRTVGGSVMMAIPKALLKDLDLATDAKVDVSVEHGRLIVSPRRKPKYTLAELLKQCDRKAPKRGRDKEWLDASPVGREIW